MNNKIKDVIASKEKRILKLLELEIQAKETLKIIQDELENEKTIIKYLSREYKD